MVFCILVVKIHSFAFLEASFIWRENKRRLSKPCILEHFGVRFSTLKVKNADSYWEVVMVVLLDMTKVITCNFNILLFVGVTEFLSRQMCCNRSTFGCI